MRTKRSSEFLLSIISNAHTHKPARTPQPTSSVLGRRSRELGDDVWSRREKVHIQEYTLQQLSEYDVPSDRHDGVIRASQASPLTAYYDR